VITRSDWFITAGGRKVHVLSPDVSTIELDDIAHALSHVCRFGGHCKSFYSVAEHSVLVSLIATQLAAAAGLSQRAIEVVALEGLMHDATEAYVGDVIRPLKRELADYEAIETLWHRAVSQRFGLVDAREPNEHVRDIVHALVKRADNLALYVEQRDLHHLDVWEAHKGTKPNDEQRAGAELREQANAWEWLRAEGFLPDLARARFMAHAVELSLWELPL
jgi:5'-deoxynucleotidase YfbR-like HD superfamily hydrolase